MCCRCAQWPQASQRLIGSYGVNFNLKQIIISLLSVLLFLPAFILASSVSPIDTTEEISLIFQLWKDDSYTSVTEGQKRKVKFAEELRPL